MREKTQAKEIFYFADVNLVAEPKPHQTGRERLNVNETGNDWDYYYDR